jgi:hypothetical protein
MPEEGGQSPAGTVPEERKGDSPLRGQSPAALATTGIMRRLPARPGFGIVALPPAAAAAGCIVGGDGSPLTLGLGMQNFFAKTVAVAMLVGGFGLTGDLGWIAERGSRVLGAADVPGVTSLGPGAEQLGEPAGPAPVLAPPAPAGFGPSAPATPLGSPAASPPAPPPAAEEPLGRPTTLPKPPAGGPEQIAWTALDTGSRVVVWLAGPPHRCLVLDFVDPVSGEAVLYEVATVSPAGRPLATAGPPRRVIVGRDAAGRTHAEGIIRGGQLLVTPVGIGGPGAGQWLGPVAALGFGD